MIDNDVSTQPTPTLTDYVFLHRLFPLRPSTLPTYGFGRIDALTDGICAIAATLLVLDIRLPEDVPAGGVGQALSQLGPSFFAYSVGFLQIAATWICLRRLSAASTGIDHYASLMLLVLLGTLSLVPFSTSVLAHSLHDSADLGSAVRLEALLLIVATVTYGAVVVYVVHRGFLRPGLHPKQTYVVERINRVLFLAPLGAFALSYASAPLALGALALELLLMMLPFDFADA